MRRSSCTPSSYSSSSSGFPDYTAITKSLQAGGWNSYLSVINNKDVHYFRVVFNSFFISVVTAVIVVVITSLAATPLPR